MRERDILHHIYEQSRALPPRVFIPPGDDMAGLRLGESDLLITVDQLIDGVHFRLEGTSLELIGRKAMTRNLSDVAAMAALPVGAVVAAALPKSFQTAQANTLFDAMRHTADQYECPLVGGDISIHDGPLILTVTVLASPAGIAPVRRHGAKPGDVVAVTGHLGAAWSRETGKGTHLTFEPRIQLARKLASLPGITIHSMIDISDGLATDLRNICEASGVGAELEAAKIPLRQGANLNSALSDGEDYELLFTLSEQAAAKLPNAIDSVPIFRIGRISSGRGLMLVQPDGTRESLERTGWEHHA